VVYNNNTTTKSVPEDEKKKKLKSLIRSHSASKTNYNREENRGIKNPKEYTEQVKT